MSEKKCKCGARMKLVDSMGWVWYCEECDIMKRATMKEVDKELYNARGD